MAKISRPMSIPELNIHPPITKAISLSEGMQQTLALLTALSHNHRVVLRASGSGVLSTSSPLLQNIVHYTGSGANDTQSGDNVRCSEVLVLGHPTNTGSIWVRNGIPATVNNAFPLGKSESISFSLDNLKHLQMLFVTDGDVAIVAYTY